MQHTNEATIIGTLGKIEIRPTSNGGEVVNLRIVTDETLARRFHREWHGAFSFEPAHIDALRSIQPGAQLRISGALRSRSYDKDGSTRYVTEIRITSVKKEGDDESPSDTLGTGRVIRDDCLAALPQLAPASVDFILTDPPYLVKYRDRKGRTVANDDNHNWLEPSARELYRVLADNAFMVSFYGAYNAEKFLTAWKAAGFRPVGHFVAVKDYASGNGYTERRHECAYVLAKGSPKLPGVRLPDVLLSTSTINEGEPRVFGQDTRG